ncbi:ferredoxin FdxA [Chromobacterium violaceum]|uniref:ferredoxin FdxA n=1 Tax=Chromobacterium violaceum TaxID=536 RepID=UPI0005BA1FF5|nr:ferredoxin FdxA [Chromobacterium violaceum]
MTYVVLSDCIGCKHSDCVDVCPTDSFHEGPNMLAINPDDCIDCGLCVPECPIDAIREDKAVPSHEHGMIALNAELAQRWPNITKSKPALPEAEAWKGRPDKLQYLEDYSETV